jgi:microcystin-dependent protein
MPQLDINRLYQDTRVLLEDYIDAIKNGVENFTNLIKLDYENFKDGGISRSKFQQEVLDTLVPVGTILPFGGDVLPDGWFYCDGSTYDAATYPELAEMMWDADEEEWIYGGTGTYPAGTFNVPDLKGRTVVGKGDMDNAVGTGGGAADRLPMLGTNQNKLGYESGFDEYPLHWTELPQHGHTGFSDSVGNNNSSHRHYDGETEDAQDFRYVVPPFFANAGSEFPAFPRISKADYDSAFNGTENGKVIDTDDAGGGTHGNHGHTLTSVNNSSYDFHRHDINTEIGTYSTNDGHLNVQPTLIFNMIIKA